MGKKIILAVLVLALLAAVGVSGWHRNYVNSHAFLGEQAYEKDAQALDLRGQALTAAEYEALRAQMPACDILWDVPFQDTAYPSDTRAIQVDRLTQEDVEQLDYLPRLERVDAAGCRDYAALAALEARRPGLQVDYEIYIGGKNVPRDARNLDLTSGEGLPERLAYLPQLESVHVAEGVLLAADLLALREAYPQADISWEKTVLGETFPDTVTELDFSGMALPPLNELEADMAYFPDLEKLILCDCGIGNEEMAAFRERVRDRYKVVWRVSMGKWNGLYLRTDETTFMPRKFKVNMQNDEMANLQYCEDLIVVDVGHMGNVKNLDWIYGTPHLQFLVMVGTGVSDLTPIGTLKELIYLELFQCADVRDYSPLAGCTALQDVNLAYTNGDASVFAQMPWLKHLWINSTRVSDENRALLTETLPDTVIEFDNGWSMGNGWRSLPNYYVMRDLLDMPYYAWGADEKP